MRWGRVVAVIGLCLDGLVAVVAVGGYVSYRHFNGQIARVNIRKPVAAPAITAKVPPNNPAGKAKPPSAASAASADGAENFLLMGTDSRSFAGQAYNVAQVVRRT